MRATEVSVGSEVMMALFSANAPGGRGGERLGMWRARCEQHPGGE